MPAVPMQLLAAVVAVAAVQRAAAQPYRLSIEHGPRRVSVTRGAATISESTCGEQSLFQAVESSMNAIHKASKLGGANFGASEFRDALTNGQLEVEMVGDAREVAVARWYAVGELVGDLGRDADLPAIRATPVETKECIYDNFNFGVDSSEIDALQRHYVEYNALLQGLPSFSDPATALAVVEVPQKRPLRIGVLGVTGAGKSTFVTAVLGRAVLSRSNEICTGAITEIEHIGDTTKKEYFIITFLDEEEKNYFIETDAKKLKDLQDRYAKECSGGSVVGDCQVLKDNLDRQKLATQAMATAVSEWQPDPVVVQSLDTDHYVSAVGGNRLPELVRKVTMRLDEDILRYATLVDTPGLRDPDPKRRRVALDAITAMDGWIYLMAAGKAETGVISDLHEIREEGHNLHGVVCISKVNTINDPTASKSLDELARAQKEMFAQYSAMPITYDSAMARAQFALIRESEMGSDTRFLLLRDILDQSYGFGFIRRLVPALRDQSFSDPLKQSFQALVEKASKHGASEDTTEFHMLEDVLTETSLLITTLRNIAELLNDKIVKRVAADRRTGLLSAVHGSKDKLTKREADLVQLIAWMDEAEKTRLEIESQQQQFIASKEQEQLVVQVSGCVGDQLALGSTTQLSAAHTAARGVQQQIETQVESWFRTSYADSSTTQQATIDGEAFNIRSMAMPFSEFFDAPASDAFFSAFDDMAQLQPKVVSECQSQFADKNADVTSMVAEAAQKMHSAIQTTMQQDSAGTAPLSDSVTGGAIGSNACWCTTNTVSRERSHCKDSICVTLSGGASGSKKTSTSPPPPEPAVAADDTAEVTEALRAIKRLGTEQATKRLQLLGRQAEIRLENAMRAATDTQGTFTESYREQTAQVAAVLHELEARASELAELTKGHERADVERQLADRRSDFGAVDDFDKGLLSLAGFDVALEQVKSQRAAEAAEAAKQKQQQLADGSHDGHDL